MARIWTKSLPVIGNWRGTCRCLENGCMASGSPKNDISRSMNWRQSLKNTVNGEFRWITLCRTGNIGETNLIGTAWPSIRQTLIIPVKLLMNCINRTMFILCFPYGPDSDRKRLSISLWILSVHCLVNLHGQVIRFLMPTILPRGIFSGNTSRKDSMIWVWMLGGWMQRNHLSGMDSHSWSRKKRPNQLVILIWVASTVIWTLIL